MIKIASNLNTLCAKRAAEEEDGDKPKSDKKRRVDYRGRAQRGAILGAIPGSVLGGLLGTAAASKGLGTGSSFYGPVSITDPKAALLSTILAGTLPGAIGGGLLGGVTGAGSNMLAGLMSEDMITRADKPARGIRGLIGALVGGGYGGLTGAAIGAERSPVNALVGGLAGAGLGATAGGLSNAYLIPWINKDMYSQDYMNKKSQSVTVGNAVADVNRPEVAQAAGRNYLLNDSLVGGGLGAGLGGGLALLLEALSDKEEKEYLASLLKGSLGGGLTGAGVGALTGYLTGAGRKQKEISAAVHRLLEGTGKFRSDEYKYPGYQQPLINVSPFSQTLYGVFKPGGTTPILTPPAERPYSVE